MEHYKLSDNIPTYVAESVLSDYTGTSMGVAPAASVERSSVPHALRLSRLHGMEIQTDDYLISPRKNGFLWTLKWDGTNFYLSSLSTSKYLKEMDEEPMLKKSYWYQTQRWMDKREDFFNQVIDTLRFHGHIAEVKVIEEQIYEYFSSCFYSQEDVDMAIEIALSYME